MEEVGIQPFDCKVSQKDILNRYPCMKSLLPPKLKLLNLNNTRRTLAHHSALPWIYKANKDVQHLVSIIHWFQSFPCYMSSYSTYITHLCIYKPQYPPATIRQAIPTITNNVFEHYIFENCSNAVHFYYIFNLSYIF